jgi:hypothetical protein
MANFFIIRNKEKNMYYWGDGSWTKSKDCAKKYQHKDCAEILMQIDRLDYKICEVIEIPSITDLEAKLAESEKLNEGYLSLIDNYIYQLNEKDEELNRYAELFGMKNKDFYVVEKPEYEKMKQGAKEIVNELKQQLAEERKKVVQEIKDKISDGLYQNSYGETFVDGDIYKILDQIEKDE